MLSDNIFVQIAKQYGTPTYIYDLETISVNVQHLRQVLPNATLLYAVKANPSGAILRHLASREIGAEVITLGELERACRAGIIRDKILLGGPRQDLPLIERALELNVKHVSLDSVSQWQLWKTVNAKQIKFYPRINPALDPKTHEHLATGAATSKFGMTVTEARDVAEDLAKLNQLAGFHVHAGSQITEASVYDAIFAVLEPLYEAYKPQHLDIGGGFGVPGFPFERFAEKVTAFARRFNLNVTIEPGRYLVAEAGVLLTKVLHVKHGVLEHVIADAGMSDLLRPALYGASHPIRALKVTGHTRTVDVDGPLCENADRLGRGITLSDVSQGDLLVIEQAGAYGHTMSSNYASSYRPAEVTVQGETITLVRKRETIEDLLRLEN
ncbi:MAG: diaminopimelate decarboxylase [Trueperaceae bacterium]